MSQFAGGVSRATPCQPHIDARASLHERLDTVEYQFHVESGEGAGRLFSVPPDRPLVIGRGSGSDVQLSDPAISRRHALLEVRDDRVWVVDLDSSNGVLINGKRVSRGIVEPGDELRLGNAVLLCSAPPPALPSVQGEVPEGSRNGLRGDATREADGPVTGPMWMTHHARPPESPEELERAQLGLSAIYQLSDLLSEELEVANLLDPVVNSVFQVTGADRVAILLKAGGADGDAPFEVVAARGRRGETVSEDEWVSRTIVREVLRRGIPTFSRDASTDERFRGGASIEIQGIRSVVCAPVKTSRRILGAVYADTLGRSDAFGERDLELLAAVGNQAGIALHRARLLEEVERLFFDMVRTVIATVDAKDGYTHRHSERVSAFGVRLARRMGLSTREQEAVQLCGLLHDVGKIGVPDAILNKPGLLGDFERREMERHPLHGVRILSNIRSPQIGLILPGVKHHHERWNGSGYPDGLAGEEIPFLARLVGVADAMDALTSRRSYREGLSMDAMLTLVRSETSTKWDPGIVESAFVLHAEGGLVVPREPGFERVRRGVLTG
ncbi:MAG: HD domain-containing phosphohydrolase [Gemmatimonadota bacterium]